ncbi:hypothetical protein PR002_g21787 [Phytophthora rubi]|uniref:Uncharacterized protein n=1 Tax=Phytophthora rubi TaxID=129364 RepID=A0A6A3IZC6_9STRA|nr:hypothetical protein PR002_g21787 [Phytophthora rubi]
MDGYRVQSLVLSAQATLITLQSLSDLARKRANQDRKKSLIPTRKTPTPDKAFCATAPPSSIAHLVLPIRSGWGSRAPRSAPRPRCTPGQVMLQPLCAAQPVERIHRRRDVHASKERSAPDPRLTRGPGGTGT